MSYIHVNTRRAGRGPHSAGLMPAMAGPASATLRFLYRFARPTQDVAPEREVCFEVDGTPRPATAYLPNDHDGHRPMPAWVLLHGRNDTLVPFSETLRLTAAIPPSARRDVTVTPLLGHAKMEGAATPWRDPAALAGETRRFIRAIHRLLSMLEDHRS
jgi:hypothetical protein